MRGVSRMAMSLGLCQLRQGWARVPLSSPIWSFARRTTKALGNQNSSSKVHWLLHQHLAPNLWHQTTQEPIQHLSWHDVSHTQQAAAEVVHVAVNCAPALHANCPAVMHVACHVNRAELLLEQSFELAPGQRPNRVRCLHRLPPHSSITLQS